MAGGVNWPGWIMAVVALLSLVNVSLIAWILWSFRKIAGEVAARVVGESLKDVIVRLAKAEDNAAHQGREIDGIQLAMKHLPDADEHQELLLSVTELRGDVKVLTTKLGGASDLFERLERKVDLLDRYLRQEEKR